MESKGRMRDPNTLTNYKSYLTTHVEANLEIDFETSRLSGNVILNLKCLSKNAMPDILLDTSYLDVDGVLLDGKPAGFQLQSRVEPYGSALRVDIEPEFKKREFKVDIKVKTTDKCTALQWLTPSQTSNKKHPYMYTPDVKSTFEFNLRSPLPVIASGLFTGARDYWLGEGGKNGTLLYTFKQDVPMPSYLFAIASGDIATAPIGPRSVVATSADELKACQWEVEADTERFIQTAEKIVSPYEWTTYNILVLPPSFLYGGMENPQYTFATPTFITGLEAAIHGEEYRDFSALIGWKALSDSIREFGEEHEFTKLIIDLEGKDPDDAFSTVPYEKGFIFLYYLEKQIGKEKWDKFIPHYFTTFARKSVDSYEFKSALISFFSTDSEASQFLKTLDWDTWFYSPGFPPKPDFDTSLADSCYALASKWENLNSNPAADFHPSSADIAGWGSNMVVVFLEAIQEFKKPLGKEEVKIMGEEYSLLKSGNAELTSRYFAIGLKARAEEVYEPTVLLLGKVGRMKFVRPLFRQLAEVDRELAVKTFEANKDFYHPICRAMLEKDLFGK